MKKTNVKMQKAERKINRKTKNDKGITLIALVITIVILIILATVTLNVVLGEGGLIDRAQQAKDLTEQAVLEEQEGLNSLMDQMANIMAEDQTPPNPPVQKSEVEEAKESGTPFQTTTTITDDLDNEVIVPGGFNIASDSGTKVEEGIVIEDSNNNQFVWIATGEYNVSTTINSTGKLTNELTRRSWAAANVVTEPTAVSKGEVLMDNDYLDFYYGEEDSRSVAYGEIDAFLESAKPVSEGGNGGFYIGRYEQGTGNVCKANVSPYISLSVTRDVAKQQAEAMYTGNTYVTGQLISSYAWDTALNFICQTNEEGYLLATTTDDAYGNIGRYRVGRVVNTGTIPEDCYSNIYDLLGNCWEWTTEFNGTYSDDNTTLRGGCVEGGYAAYRCSGLIAGSSAGSGLRCFLPPPALYKS